MEDLDGRMAAVGYQLETLKKNTIYKRNFDTIPHWSVTAQGVCGYKAHIVKHSVRV